LHLNIFRSSAHLVNSATARILTVPVPTCLNEEGDSNDFCYYTVWLNQLTSSPFIRHYLFQPLCLSLTNLSFGIWSPIFYKS